MLYHFPIYAEYIRLSQTSVVDTDLDIVSKQSEIVWKSPY